MNASGNGVSTDKDGRAPEDKSTARSPPIRGAASVPAPAAPGSGLPRTGAAGRLRPAPWRSAAAASRPRARASGVCQPPLRSGCARCRAPPPRMTAAPYPRSRRPVSAASHGAAAREALHAMHGTATRVSCMAPRRAPPEPLLGAPEDEREVRLPFPGRRAHHNLPVARVRQQLTARRAGALDQRRAYRPRRRRRMGRRARPRRSGSRGPPRRPRPRPPSGTRSPARRAARAPPRARGRRRPAALQASCCCGSAGG